MLLCVTAQAGAAVAAEDTFREAAKQRVFSPAGTKACVGLLFSGHFFSCGRCSCCQRQAAVGGRRLVAAWHAAWGLNGIEILHNETEHRAPGSSRSFVLVLYLRCDRRDYIVRRPDRMYSHRIIERETGL